MKRRFVWLGIIVFSPLAAGCAKSDVPRAMTAHFTEAHVIHTALVFGNLDQARVRAQALAESASPEGLPSGSDPYVERMRVAASGLAGAWVVEAGAVASGELAATCGACHQAFGKGPVVALMWQPASGEGLLQHMDRHRWAVDRMWDGLMIPSDDWWIQGTEMLREDPLGSETLAALGGEDAANAGREIHELGHVGRGLRDPLKRAELYGKVMATCVHCHERTRDQGD